MTDLKQAKRFKDADFIGSEAASEAAYDEGCAV